MASNNTRNQQQNNNNEEKGGSWLLPAAIGMAVGAGLAYMLGKSEQSENCSRSSNSRSTGQSTFSAPARGCCSICQDDYDSTITLRCGHVIHRECYESMRQHTRGELLCPLCRKRAE